MATRKTQAVKKTKSLLSTPKKKTKDQVVPNAPRKANARKRLVKQWKRKPTDDRRLERTNICRCLQKEETFSKKQWHLMTKYLRRKREQQQQNEDGQDTNMALRSTQWSFLQELTTLDPDHPVTSRFINGEYTRTIFGFVKNGIVDLMVGNASASPESAE